MKPVKFAALAQDDVRESYAWFAERSELLALRWVEAVETTVARVSEEPQLFQVVEDDIRRAIVRKFPFGVFFYDAGDYLRVIAVVDLRRDPATWQSRR